PAGVLWIWLMNGLTIATQGSPGGATPAWHIPARTDPGDDPPVAVNDTYVLNADAPLIVGAPGGLGNDRDGDGDALTAVPVSGSGPTHGTLTLHPDGSFTYTPTAGYTGPDSFTYKANDGTVDSPPATVALTVIAGNVLPVAQPVAQNDHYTTP